MPELRFDIRGNLTPYELVEVPYPVFREIFVDAFEEDSTRHGLWVSFERYLANLRTQVGEPVQVWVGGSFVTAKRNPEDIDVVFFFNADVYDPNRRVLDAQFLSWETKLKTRIDAYSVKIVPVGHQERLATDFDAIYWLDLFGRTRPNRQQKRYEKGFVQLIT